MEETKEMRSGQRGILYLEQMSRVVERLTYESTFWKA